MQFAQISSLVTLGIFLSSVLPAQAQYFNLPANADQALNFPCTDLIGPEIQNNAARIRQNIARSSRDAQSTSEAHSSSSSDSYQFGVQLPKGPGLSGQTSNSESSSDSYSQSTDTSRSSDDGYELQYDYGTTRTVAVEGRGNCDSANQAEASVMIQGMQITERQTQYLYDRILGPGSP